MQSASAATTLDYYPKSITWRGAGVIDAPPQEAAGLQAATIELESISLSFGGVKALSGVDLSVRPGEIRALIGPNGAGKSSLINIISGLYRPDSGRIWFDGHSFAQMPTQRLARLGIARTFQNLALFKGLSVIENIAIGLVDGMRATFIEQIVGLGRARREVARARQLAHEVVDLFDLQAVRHRSAATLPYGLQKRVELARALVARPKLLLLDEPMAGISASEKREMSHFIRLAREQYDATIILIEHDIGVVMGLSDRVAVLDYGRKIADGTPEEVSADPLVIDAYLGAAHAEEKAEAA